MSKNNEDESSMPLLEQKTEAKTNMAQKKTKNTGEFVNVFIEPVLEKEPFRFDLNSPESCRFDEFSKDFQTINATLEHISSELLSHWTKVQVVLPDSIIDEDTRSSDQDLFILPSINELEEVSIDHATGHRKRLNNDQLDSIKKTGSFEVASVNFADKKHTWKLARWLQKGSARANESFLRDLSKAVELLVITARNRFVSRRFSLLSGLRSWRSSASNLIDILVGMPRLKDRTGEIDKKIRDELQKFLVSDLKVDETEKELYEEACSKIMSTKEDWELERSLSLLRLPSQYRTPQNLLVDLRLLDSELIEKIRPILEVLVKNTPERRLLLRNLRDKLVEKYQEQGLANSEIQKKVTRKLVEEYREAVFRSISESLELEGIAAGITRLLCDSARSFNIMQDEAASSQEELEEHMSVFTAELKRKHGVKSLIYTWLAEQVNAERSRFEEANVFAVNVRTLEKLKQANLYQAAYFVERELIFLKEVKLVWEYSINIKIFLGKVSNRYKYYLLTVCNRV